MCYNTFKMEARSFNRLLKSIKNDENSFNELYRFYARRIVYRLSLTYGRELAEDVAHDFFLKLIMPDHEYQYIDRPTSWVYACCDNIAKTKIKSEFKYVPLDASIECPCIDDLVPPDLQSAFNELDEITCKILKLYYWEGYNLEEISEMLNIKYATVRKKHSRAKAKLKKFLK